MFVAISLLEPGDRFSLRGELHEYIGLSRGPRRRGAVFNVDDRRRTYSPWREKTWQRFCFALNDLIARCIEDEDLAFLRKAVVERVHGRWRRLVLHWGEWLPADDRRVTDFPDGVGKRSPALRRLRDPFNPLFTDAELMAYRAFLAACDPSRTAPCAPSNSMKARA